MTQVNHDLMTRALSEITVKSSAKDMSIYRVMGHKQDMPGSGQWRMQTNSDEKQCWVCNGTIYNLIFWTRGVGKYHVQQRSQIDDYEKRRIIEQI